MIMIYYLDKKLKKVACPGSWSDNNCFKNWVDIANSRDAFFTVGLQITTIALVSVNQSS